MSARKPRPAEPTTSSTPTVVADRDEKMRSDVDERTVESSERDELVSHYEQRKDERKDMPARRLSDPGGRWSCLGWPVVEILIAEIVGTALLMFFGCMGLVRVSPDTNLPPLQSAIVFAVVVTTIIQIFGHISAAHLNPTVTIAFVLLGKVTPAMALVYIFSECVGAILGYGLLISLIPVQMIDGTDSPGLCCTIPHQYLTPVQGVALEFFATCFLILVVCACSDVRNSVNTDSTPLKFGATILALSITVGPYTGASMNPARSLAPALWTGTWTGHWIYWLGPCLGGFTSTIFYQALFNRQQIEKHVSVLEETPLTRVKVTDTQRKDVKEKEANNR